MSKSYDPESLHRQQTAKMIGVQQTFGPYHLFGSFFLVAHGIGTGFLWFGAEKTVVAAGNGAKATNSFLEGAMTAVGSGSASSASLGGAAPNEDAVHWGQWYHTMGHIIIISQVIAGLALFLQFILNNNEHVVKAAKYHAEGREEEAAAEEAEEGCCIRLVMCFHGLINCAQCCFACIPTIWCCIGLFMVCFGLGSGVRVESGLNDYSKYYLIVLFISFVFAIVACCCYSLCSAMGIHKAASLFGDESEEEEEDNE